MKLKRKQYLIKQVKIQDLEIIDNKITVKEEPPVVANSENLFYDMLYRVQGKEYIPVYKSDEGKTVNENIMDEFIILKTPTIKEDEEEKLEFFKKIMTEGIWINDTNYVREGSVKSASMTRTQKTLLIRVDLKEKVKEYSSLGKTPTETIISKMETAKGLLLSTSLLLEDCTPNIVIIPDFEKTLKHDVKIVEEYEVSE